MIVCPYCLNRINPELKLDGNKKIYICPIKKEEIHRDLVEKRFPRTTIGLVGFSGHGKTVYLTSLFYLLKVLQSGRIWGENFLWNSIDDNTHKIMYVDVPKFENSELPDSTPENFPLPAVIQFYNIPFFKNYFMSFYDTAGRVFEETEKITDMGRFVALSNIIFFNISVKDCDMHWADHMKGLLEIYINAVYNKLHIDLNRNQHIIVILSKADLIDELPKRLKKHLYNGSYTWYQARSYQSINIKLRELQERSLAIEKWLVKKGCKGFTTLAKQKFRSVDYTVVSSTGAAPSGNRLYTKLLPEDPKRVLDPLLLGLEKVHPKGVIGIWRKLYGR